MKRLPMGLKISPSAFSRIMSIAMSGLNFEKCITYMDDLIIIGRNLEIHNQNLIKVLERLRKVNLKINPKKCNFCKKELLYLGHIVTAEGVLPDPEKVKAIQNYTTPQNSDDVRRFVAMCNYYRKFIPHFADITIPLNKLCRKHIKFEWTENCQNSFEILKQALVTPPILEYPNFSTDNEFVLQTDASGISIGSVLCNKNLKPIAYASRPLNKAELNYPTIQKELLSVVWSVKYFRPYLFGRKFTIMTDHKPLIYLFSIRDPSSRLLKFRLQLEEYDYNIVYIKGKDNVIADALSRITLTSNVLKSLSENIFVTTRAQSRKMREENSLKELKGRQFPSSSLDISSKPTDLRPDQPKIVEILRKPIDSVEMKCIEGKELDRLRKKNLISKEDKCLAYVENQSIIYINLNFMSQFTRDVFVNILSDFCKKINVKEICIIKEKNNDKFIKELCEEIDSRNEWSGPPRIHILRNVKRVTDRDEKTVILNDFHLLPSSGHAGVRRMVNNIKSKYYWPGLENDVRNYVSKCSKCQVMKHSPSYKEPMVITTTANSAFEKVFLDLVGPLDKDNEGNQYILTLQCELTKYVEAYPIPTKESTVVARSLLTNFILRYGVPRVIGTDRGTEFMSSTMTEVCKLLEIEKINSTAYHHESIGALENTHKALRNFLRIQCEENSYTWSHWLPFWCFSYNTTVHTSTNYTPYELVFGKPCNIPSRLKDDLEPLYNFDNYALELKYRLQLAHRDARKRLIDSKIVRKVNYDQNKKPISYKKDDLILIRNESSNKMDRLFNGPYVVIEEVGPNVKIIKNGKVDTVHKNRTKPYIG